MKVDFTVVEDNVRAADIVAVVGDTTISPWVEVKVLSLQSHAHKYAAPDEVYLYLIELDNVRWTPDQARTIAECLIKSADIADEMKSNHE